MTPILTAEAVHAIMRDCLFRENDPRTFEMQQAIEAEVDLPDYALKVEGVVRTFVLDRAKVDAHRDDVAALLAELPPEFRSDLGGGWTFLNACNDKHGHQWGEHADVETLLVLGLATGLARYATADRDLWRSMPGSLPYFMVEVR
jgi:hypothetical protein